MVCSVSEKYAYVVGADTHAQKHVVVVIDNHGAVIATREVRFTGPQMNGFISWIRKVTGNAGNVLLAIEGTSSYGETLTKLALANGTGGSRSEATEDQGPRWGRQNRPD